MIKIIAPTPSQRHAMINTTKIIYVGIKWVRKANIASLLPYPSLNMSKANKPKNNANIMLNILGLQ